jgi:hypothetical protein
MFLMLKSWVLVGIWNLIMSNLVEGEPRHQIRTSDSRTHSSGLPTDTDTVPVGPILGPIGTGRPTPKIPVPVPVAYRYLGGLLLAFHLTAFFLHSFSPLAQ